MIKKVVVRDFVLVFGIGFGDWFWGLVLGFWGLVLGIGFGDWFWGLVLGIGFCEAILLG